MTKLPRRRGRFRKTANTRYVNCPRCGGRIALPPKEQLRALGREHGASEVMIACAECRSVLPISSVHVRK